MNAICYMHASKEAPKEQILVAMRRVMREVRSKLASKVKVAAVTYYPSDQKVPCCSCQFCYPASSLSQLHIQEQRSHSCYLNCTHTHTHTHTHSHKLTHVAGPQAVPDRRPVFEGQFTRNPIQQPDIPAHCCGCSWRQSRDPCPSHCIHRLQTLRASA